MSAIETPEFLNARSTSSAARIPITTTRLAGRTPWIRPTSGPSRWPRTGAGRVTEPSSTGRTGSRQGRDAVAVPSRHRRRADDPRSSRPARAGFGKRRGAAAHRRRQHALLVQRRQGGGTARDAYFEMFGNRGIYHKGWTAVTRHKTPWLLIGEKPPPLSTTTSGNSTTRQDWSQSNDLARQMPEKLHELQRLWLIEATRTTCCRWTTISPALEPGRRGPAGADQGKHPASLPRHGPTENCVISIKNKSHSVTAEIVVPQTDAEGVIIAQGATSVAGACTPRVASSNTATTWVVCSTFMSRPRASCPPATPGAHGVRLRRGRPG